jgi:hypothetical protein
MRNFLTTSLATVFTLVYGTSATATLFDPAINRRIGADHSLCAAELLDSGVSREVTATACAQALVPSDLSLCVAKINRLTPIAANDALAACTRVRRPVEMSTCVVDIYRRTQETNTPVTVSSPNLILDGCRRSLLPLRFTDCVIGLSQRINFANDVALRTCNAAESR